MDEPGIESATLAPFSWLNLFTTRGRVMSDKSFSSRAIKVGSKKLVDREKVKQMLLRGLFVEA